MANGRFPRPPFACEGFVDDGDQRRAGAVAVRESAALPQRNAHGAEVIAIRVVKQRDGHCGRLRRRPVQDRVEPVAAIAHRWRAVHSAYGRNPRQAVQVAFQLAVEAADSLRALVRRGRQHQVERQHMLGDKTGIGRLGRDQVAQQQSGGKGQHQRDGDLGHDQCAPRSLPAPPGRRAGTVFQGGDQVRPPGGEHRRDTGEQPGQYGDSGRKQQHAPIERGLRKTWNVARPGGNERARSPLRQQTAGHAAQRRQQQILGKQLPDQTPPAGADGRADADFACAGGGARQHQAGHVRACDNQHQSRGCQQDQQRGTDVASHGFGQEDARGAMLRLGSRVRLGQAPHDQIQVRDGGSQRRSRF